MLDQTTPPPVAAPASAHDDRVIMRDDLCAQLDVHRETVRRWLRDGRLPKPDVAITVRRIGWRRSTLVAAGIGVV